MVKSVNDKFNTVIEKNTFYFFNRRFEENYEGYLNSIRETLLVLKNDIETKGLKKEIFKRLLADNENGLSALLALTGFSNESLKRLITLIRVVDNRPLAILSLKKKWHKPEDLENIKVCLSSCVRICYTLTHAIVKYGGKRESHKLDQGFGGSSHSCLWRCYGVI